MEVPNQAETKPTETPDQTETKAKKLEEYKQDKPQELKLFEVTSLIVKEQKNPYSNSIDFYDAIPKYFWGKQDKKNQPKAVKRKFVYQNVAYNVLIQPAILEAKDGTLETHFPGEREELVEDALRKLASEGNGIFLDNHASVLFSLYELRQELKRMGHGYSNVQIKEAIIICGKTNMQVKQEDGKAIFIGNLFETVGLKTQEDWKGQGTKTKAFVRLNFLVTRSIKEKTFRLVNYDKLMSYKKSLSRWLHKRISHNYRQASETDLYTISLSRIINDSGVKQYKDFRNHLCKIKDAVEEMKVKEVLADYKIEPIIDGRKIIDAKITLIPYESFIKEMKFFNFHHTEMRSQEIKEEALAKMRSFLKIDPPK